MGLDPEAVFTRSEGALFHNVVRVLDVPTILVMSTVLLEYPSPFRISFSSYNFELSSLIVSCILRPYTYLSSRSSLDIQSCMM